MYPSALFFFRAELRDGFMLARLFDAGAPNRLEDPWRPAKMTDVLLRIQNRSDTEIKDGLIYVVRSFWVESGTLILPPRGLNSSVTELRRCRDADLTAAEMFSRLGSWSFANKPSPVTSPRPSRLWQLWIFLKKPVALFNGITRKPVSLQKMY